MLARDGHIAAVPVGCCGDFFAARQVDSVQTVAVEHLIIETRWGRSEGGFEGGAEQAEATIGLDAGVDG
jgi:hypothetical protein